MTKERKDVLVGAIEAGGTKFVCAVGSGPGSRMLAKTSFQTGNNEDHAGICGAIALGQGVIASHIKNC